MKHTIGKYLALAGCIIGAATLMTQFVVTMSLSMAAGRSVLGSVIFFFSFFTILSNILAVLCFAASIFTKASKPLAFFRSSTTQTAVAVYMLVVAVIYIGILEALWAPEGLMRALDRLLHYVMPALFLIHWTISVPKGRVAHGDAARWLVFPFFYAVYVFIRGAITGEYPYPIMNAAELGYPAALRNTSFVLILFVFLGVAFVSIDRRLGRPITQAES
jgi:hypothetical protein